MNSRKHSGSVKRAVDFLNGLSPHNVWHPHDSILFPIAKRRLSERAEHAITLIQAESRRRTIKDCIGIINRLPKKGASERSDEYNLGWRHMQIEAAFHLAFSTPKKK